jgi:hypothetical protein
MNQRIDKIRQLLNELESEPNAQLATDRDFSASELPLIIQQIVDDLQPQLSPYDAAFYWFLFRHSIAKDGDPHLRVSTRQLQHGRGQIFLFATRREPGLARQGAGHACALSKPSAPSARKANPTATAHSTAF